MKNKRLAESMRVVARYILDEVNQKKPMLTMDIYWAAVEVLECSYEIGDEEWTQKSMDFLTVSGDPIRERQLSGQ